jgi:hypothetical protein
MWDASVVYTLCCVLSQCNAEPQDSGQSNANLWLWENSVSVSNRYICADIVALQVKGISQPLILRLLGAQPDRA